MNPPPNIIPVNQRVLIQINPRNSFSIVLPDAVEDPSADAIVLVKAIAEHVTACSPGDHLILIPNCNILGVDKDRRLALIHESSVMAIDRRGIKNN